MLSTYRSLLRQIYKFPISELRSKMRFNAREVFDLYMEDGQVPQDFLEGIKEDTKLLKDLCQVEPTLLVQMYQPFAETVRKSQISIEAQ
jgi:hypothetical protein